MLGPKTHEQEQQGLDSASLSAFLDNRYTALEETDISSKEGLPGEPLKP